MFIKKFLKPKKDSSTTVIRNFGFANTTSAGQNGITDFSNIDSKNINTINLSAVNAEITNLENQNFTNTNSAIFEGELIGRGTVDLEDAAVKLGSNNTFDELTGSDTSKLYSNDITCDYLTVNKKAHFFELVIDKIKTVGGTVIFTPADGFTIDKVVEGNDDYILFWRACTEVAEGEIGDTISETGQIMTEPVSVNMWQEWDQALCQSLNLGDESDYYFDVSNRYWWRVVESASDDPEIQEINGVKYYCHWIMVYKNGTSSTTDKPLVDTGSDVPAVGDAVAMLGYRYDEIVNYTQDDVNRASAIIIAAYNTPDSEITAPSYAQYQGIKDFSLSRYRKTYFDATRGKIFGEFVVDAGGGNTVDLDDYIKSFNNANPLEGFISTNNNQTVDLVVLQTEYDPNDGNNKIHDLNNFPNNLQVIVNYEGTPQMEISDYDVLTLTLFGVTYDLLEANNYTPNLPSNYQGIYVSNISKSQYQPFRLTLAFTGSEQVITTSSMVLHAEISNGSDTYILNKNIPINGVSSVEGVDAEFYGLNTILENAQVDGNQTLQPELIYNLKYISGTNVTYPTPSGQSLRVTTYLNNGTSSTVPVQWDNANNYWRFYPNATTNYYTKTQETPPVAVPIYYTVELVDNNVVVDAKVVDVQLSPMATFSVGETLTTLIYAETTRVENESNNKYSSLLVNINGLTSTVSNITNDLTGVHGDISRIDQKADSISLHVDTIDNGLQTTGIDITNGKINLNADNTNINGNLNVYNAKQGIIVYDSNNNPKISITADNLGGSYDSYSTNIGTAYDYLYESTTKKTAGASTYTAQIIDIELGYLKNNTELILNTSAGSTDPYNENNYILVKFYKSLIDGKYSQIVEGSITSASYSLTFSNGTSSISRSGNFTIDNSVPAYETILYFPNINVTLNADGNWIISGNVTLTLAGDKRTLECYYCGHQLFYIIGADAAVNKISLDGMLIKPSSNNINWFGSDMTAFSNGLHEIRITSNGIKERNYINSNTGTYNENPLSCSQTVQLVSNDGTSINDDTTCVLLLDNLHPMGVLLPKPDSNNYIEGRTIYIKNESIQTHNIVADWYSSGSGIVIPKDSNFDDTMRNSRYDYGRYLPVPPKSQMTLICIHNENISVPRWYAF